jgi:putative tricarboxylic transport membrane protein
MIESLLAGLDLALRVDTFIWISGGLLLGMLMGALPGFTTTMGMSVLVPISFLVGDPLIGIPFLIGVYKGGIYGGSVPAILIAMPGTGASIATVFDGHELTKKGRSRKALEMSLFASAISDFLSDVFTLVMIIPVAAIVLGFGPPEIAAVMFLSLVIIAVTATGPVIKGLIMLCLGVWVGFVGADPFSAMADRAFRVAGDLQCGEGGRHAGRSCGKFRGRALTPRRTETQPPHDLQIDNNRHGHRHHSGVGPTDRRDDGLYRGEEFVVAPRDLR